MSTAQNQNRPKILRIGVIQGGKIIEERLIRRRESVTIGHGSRNTLVIPASTLPESFNVFELKGTQYQLRFTPAMTGRLSVGDGQLDFAALTAQGLARADRDALAVPLTDQSKGKIALGEVTLLFQFVTPPPEAPKPVLPAIAKGSVWTTMDHVFFGVLAAVLLFNFGTIKVITLRDLPAEEELTLEELPDRFVKMIIPEKPPEQPKKEEVAQNEGDKKDDKADDKKADKPKNTAPVDAAERRAQVAKNVAQKGLLKVLGALGDGSSGGAIEDVLGSGTASADIASALAGAGGVNVATGDALAAGAGRKGGGTGETAGIGDLATAGGAGASGQLGEKKAAAISGRVIDQGPEIESSNCDRDAITRYVKTRIKAVQACYERELKRNTTLKGKVTIRFTIGTTGRVTEIEVEENTLGDEAVVSCIRNTIRMWMFPIKDTECPVSYPFVFTPAS